jgi:hypothetical protein
VVFELVETTPGVYLHHRSLLGEFRLASDAVIPTFRKDPTIARIIEQSPDEMADFMRIGYTIGGMMLFPGNRVGGLTAVISYSRRCFPFTIMFVERRKPTSSIVCRIG